MIVEVRLINGSSILGRKRFNIFGKLILDNPVELCFLNRKLNINTSHWSSYDKIVLNRSAVLSVSKVRKSVEVLYNNIVFYATTEMFPESEQNIKTYNTSILNMIKSENNYEPELLVEENNNQKEKVTIH